QQDNPANEHCYGSDEIQNTKVPGSDELERRAQIINQWYEKKTELTAPDSLGIFERCRVTDCVVGVNHVLQKTQRREHRGKLIGLERPDSFSNFPLKSQQRWKQHYSSCTSCRGQRRQAARSPPKSLLG